MSINMVKPTKAVRPEDVAVSKMLTGLKRGVDPLAIEALRREIPPFLPLTEFEERIIRRDPEGPTALVSASYRIVSGAIQLAKRVKAAKSEDEKVALADQLGVKPTDLTRLAKGADIAGISTQHVFLTHPEILRGAIAQVDREKRFGKTPN